MGEIATKMVSKKIKWAAAFQLKWNHESSNSKSVIEQLFVWIRFFFFFFFF